MPYACVLCSVQEIPALRLPRAYAGIVPNCEIKILLSIKVSAGAMPQGKLQFCQICNCFTMLGYRDQIGKSLDYKQ